MFYLFILLLVSLLRLHSVSSYTFYQRFIHFIQNPYLIHQHFIVFFVLPIAPWTLFDETEQLRPALWWIRQLLESLQTCSDLQISTLQADNNTSQEKCREPVFHSLRKDVSLKLVHCSPSCILLFPKECNGELLEMSLPVCLSLFRATVGMKQVEKVLRMLKNPDFDIFSLLYKFPSFDVCDRIACNMAKPRTNQSPTWDTTY